MLSAAYFFLILFGYFLLRPLREAMGVERSMDDLRWLYGLTCTMSLVVAVAFGGVVAHTDRARFILIGHLVIVACLLVFIAVRGLVGEDAKVWSGYAFYVWLSVINLFLTGLFWGFMADVWRHQQCMRLFPVIAVGGTLGGLIGSTFAWQMVEIIGPLWQMGLSAFCFAIAIPLVGLIDRNERATTGRPIQPIGGSWKSGVLLVARSPYLMGAGLYVIFLAISNTMLYFTRTELVANAQSQLEARASMFAQMDTWMQATTLIMQVFLTGRLIRVLGVGITLAILPVVTVAGFAILAWIEQRPGIAAWQIFGAVTAFSALHSATRFAIARPTRETLFSVVSEEEKYKAKPVVDLFLYRGGDVAGAGMTAWVAGLWGMLMIALPLAAVWGVLCWSLATAQSQRARKGDCYVNS